MSMLIVEAIRSARETVRIQDAALGADQLMAGAAEMVFDKLGRPCGLRWCRLQTA
jgi:hypothetical protein